eukprot:5256523-Pleurochrysis_carterae.AAC.6
MVSASLQEPVINYMTHLVLEPAVNGRPGARDCRRAVAILGKKQAQRGNMAAQGCRIPMRSAATPQATQQKR